MAIRTLTCLVLACILCTLAWSAPAGDIEFPVVRTTVAPAIDGNLHDAAWEEARVPSTTWLTYNPVRGERLEQETEVWMTYDDRNLYIAFRCRDPEPAKIKTSITRRDNLFNDDWIGLSLDSMFNGQSSYSSTTPAIES